MEDLVFMAKVLIEEVEDMVRGCRLSPQQTSEVIAALENTIQTVKVCEIDYTEMR